ncbi:MULTISPECIES: hypothetical protein [Spirulina sp. CCY15215]|uniref:hypothetical protein n=1 Tax=Spirulina sp. CCY15215 TaxID=2767591 RepID=UPI00195008A9|nr:hypothetical protein [Spirulina major]
MGSIFDFLFAIAPTSQYETAIAVMKKEEYETAIAYPERHDTIILVAKIITAIEYNIKTNIIAVYYRGRRSWL